MSQIRKTLARDFFAYVKDASERRPHHARHPKSMARWFMASGYVTHRTTGRDGTAIAMLGCIGLALASTVLLLTSSDALMMLSRLAMQGVPFL
jgi:hypothetical protein